MASGENPFENTGPETDAFLLITDGLNHLSQGIVIFDRLLNLVAWNKPAERLLDFPADLMKPGANLSEFFRFNAARGEYGEGDIETLVAERVELARRFEPHHFERIRPNGKILEIIGSPLPSGGFVATYTDITERKSAETLSTANRRLLQQTIDAAPVAISIKDSDKRFVFANRYSAERHGLQPAAFEGRVLEEVLAEHGDPAFIRETSSNDDRVISSGEALPFFEETVVIRGEVFRMMTSKTPLFDDNGDVAYVITIALDITDRKLAEVALGDALREAEQANRAKSEFLATISHEFRTPLNAISGFSEMLMSQFLGPLGAPKYLEYAGDIHASSDHLLLLVNDVLDLSAIEAGKMPIDKSQLELEDIVDDFSAIIAAPVSHKGIRLTTLIPDNPRPLYADRRALRQIFLNLLSNAVKFTPTGGQIQIRITQNADKCAFEICDTGQGIPENKLQRITDPFVRAEPSPHMAQEGAGLGLAIVKSLVDLHGGELLIASEIDKGTTITVVLPMDAEPPDETPSP